MVYIKDNLNCCKQSDIKTCANSESVWVEIRSEREHVVLGVIYRPPSLDRVKSKIIYDEISKADRQSRVCIIGNFNFSTMNWDYVTRNLEAEKFLDMVHKVIKFELILATVNKECRRIAIKF